MQINEMGQLVSDTPVDETAQFCAIQMDSTQPIAQESDGTADTDSMFDESFVVQPLLDHTIDHDHVTDVSESAPSAEAALFHTHLSVAESLARRYQGSRGTSGDI